MPRKLKAAAAAIAVLGFAAAQSWAQEPAQQPWALLQRWACGNEPLGPAVAPLPAVATGDLVFLDLECGDICDAISESTQQQFGVDGPRLSHVGIVETDGGLAYVWEAWPGRGVQRVPLSLFLARVKAGEGRPEGYYVGRLSPAARASGRAALARVQALSGTPYDDRFAWDGPGTYCAKLISAGFAAAGDFRPQPMFYGRAGSRARAFWTAYFAARGLPVPDGEPGVSPLGIYLEGRTGIFLP
jgi:hypothetical protein